MTDKLSERQVQRAIELAYPHKALWPNGRAKWPQVSREKKSHRRAAWLATLEAFGVGAAWDGGQVKLAYTVHPKPTGPLPDLDNTLAAMKAYQDGIADALKLNDAHFAMPTVTFGERCKGGKVVVNL